MLKRVSFRALWGALVVIAVLGGCKKEVLTTDQPESESTIALQNTSGVSVSGRTLTLSNAQQLYQQKKAIAGNSNIAGDEKSLLPKISTLKPLWDFSTYWLYGGTDSVLVVPTAGDVCDEPKRSKQSYIIFFNSPKNGELTSRFLFIQSAEGYTITADNISNFSGNIIQVDWEGNVVDSYSFKDGEISAALYSDRQSTPRTEWECEWVIVPFYLPTSCGTYTVWLEGYECVRVGGGAGGDGGPLNDPDPFGWGDRENANPLGNPPSGSSGGSPYNIGNYFNLSNLTGTNMLNAQLINQFKDKNCLNGSGPWILDQIKEECGLSDDPEDIYIELKQMMQSSSGNLPSCLQDAIIQDRITQLQQGGINVNPGSLTENATETETLVSCQGNEAVDIAIALDYNADEIDWLLENKVAIKFFADKSIHHESSLDWKLCKYLTALHSQNLTPFDVENLQTQNLTQEYLGYLNEDGWPIDVLTKGIEFYINNEAIKLKKLNPDKYPTDILGQLQLRYDATKATVHILLDIGGLFPATGEVCDLTNMVLYSFDGDVYNASASAISAIPFVGWFSFGKKYAEKIVTINGTIKRLTWRADDIGTVTFGSGDFLRKVIDAPPGTQAHHIIPWNLQSNNVVQTAAKRDGASPWHMNSRENGIPLGPEQHLGQHNAYNGAIGNKLYEINQTLTGLSLSEASDMAYNKLIVLTTKVRTILEANPHLKVSDPIIVNLINQITL